MNYYWVLKGNIKPKLKKLIKHIKESFKIMKIKLEDYRKN